MINGYYIFLLRLPILNKTKPEALGYNFGSKSDYFSMRNKYIKSSSFSCYLFLF